MLQRCWERTPETIGHPHGHSLLLRKVGAFAGDAVVPSEAPVTSALGRTPASGSQVGGGEDLGGFNLDTGKTLITFFFFWRIKGQEYSCDSLPSFDRYMIIGWFHVCKGQR